MITSALQPLSIGKNEIKNRFIMGSMHTGLEELPNGFEAMAAYFAERAKGEVGLIITGGVSPNNDGRLWPGAICFNADEQISKHKVITEAVHEAGGKIAMQILHAGRYGVHDKCVSASAIQAPINIYTPRALSIEEIQTTIQDFANCARRAEEAGYDGIEIMGSEGYFLHQFIAPRTNKREDEYGGTFENRMRLPLEIIAAIREVVSEKFMLIYRISVVDLVEEGSSKEEVIQFAKALEAAGVHLLNTGIGWHEARIPTISMRVPRGSFVWAAELLKQHVSIPVSATNRINTPELAEEIISSGKADAVSMARPLLADPHFVLKAKNNQSNLINTCVGCNQACLDQIFSGEIASCLVNPFAARELTLQLLPSTYKKKIAVVGAGVAGLTAALVLAQRGNEVEVFEQQESLGGQLRLAAQVPGKEEFFETIRYYTEQLKHFGVKIHLNTSFELKNFQEGNFEELVWATGVVPSGYAWEENDGSLSVLNYVEAIQKNASLGIEVVVLGAGGIAMDVASLLTQKTETKEEYSAHWGIDVQLEHRGALQEKQERTPLRKVSILQRSNKKLGNKLGKTTVWSHRTELQQLGVGVFNGSTGLKILGGELLFNSNGIDYVLQPNAIVLCLGQRSAQTDVLTFVEAGIPLHVLGGAHDTNGLDAKKVIREATEWALKF
jgi:2,4-dienoyl-CoA reductase (NADPH2)